MVRMLNFALYQIGWFACVFGAAYSRPWLGIAIAIPLIGVHMSLATDRHDQFKLLCIALGVGLMVDTALLNLGVYRFPSGMLVSWLPPLWMSALWVQFGTTLRYCFKWLSGKYILSSLLGFFGAPIAFLGGERLGAIIFLPPRNLNLFVLSMLWCLGIPLLIYASDRIYVNTPVASSYRRIG